MYDVITIGTATEDLFLRSPLFRVLRDPRELKKIGVFTGEAQCFALGAKIEIKELAFATGGGATNAAVTFGRQGFKTASLIRINKDEASEHILKELQKEKIVPFAIKDEKQKTAHSVILLAPGGERTILVYRGASDDLKIKEIPFNKLKARWAYVSPGNIEFSVIKMIFNHFSENKTLIAFNPSKYFLSMGARKLKPLLSKSKVVILNREEASYLTGIDYKKEREVFRKLNKLVSGIAIMTQGPEGVSISDGIKIYRADIFPGKLIDRTGAGDAFGSGFVTALIKYQISGVRRQVFNEEQIKYAIRLGTANATSVIENIGAKSGILKRRQFEKNPRWKKLAIKTIKIK